MISFITYQVYLFIWTLCLAAITHKRQPANWNRFAWLAGPFVALIAMWVPDNPVGGTLAISLPEVSAVLAPESQSGGISIADGYMMVALCFLLFSMYSIARVIQLRRKAKTTDSDYLILSKATQTQSPFSFFQWIFLPEGLDRSMKDCVLAHERVHVRRKHSWDVMFVETLRVICWINPGVYLMKRGLSVIHEYEADMHTSKKMGMKRYLNVLVNSALGNHSVIPLVQPFSKATIKNRINMFNKKKSTRYAWILPLLMAGVFVSVQACSKKSDQNDLIEVVTSPDKQPEFPGGMDQMGVYIANNLKYPEEAKQSNTSGMVVVSFVVDADGRVTGAEVIKSLDAACDQAAIEVIEGMPEWTPATVEGNPVATELKLPIRFQLD